MTANRGRLVWLVGVFLLAASALLGETRNVDSAPPVLSDPQPKPGKPGGGAGGGPGATGPAKGEPGADDDDTDDALADRPPPLVKLTKSQINKLRYMELRGMRIHKLPTPDRVSVKIAREVIDDFLLEMEGHEDFGGKKHRKAFLKMTAPQKLNVIAHYRGAAYADRVEIKNDPEIFVEFRRNVMPIVQRTCATTGCHGQTNQNAAGFRLFKDPKRTSPTTYANFVVLNELNINGHPMVNRSHPDDSLLLTYMLPEKDVPVELRHPGGVKFKPVFQKRKAMGFERISRWIAALKHPAEDYGVHIISSPDEPVPDEPAPDEPEPPTQPAPTDRPATQPTR